MTVHIEVPEGHKCCSKCGGIFPKATGFYAKRVTAKSGAVYFYPEPRCIGCKLASKRVDAVRERRAGPKVQNLDAVGHEIAEACYSAEQIVFRAKGRIRWLPYGQPMPGDVELLGRFNMGADWRDLRGSLEA